MSESVHEDHDMPSAGHSHGEMHAAYETHVAAKGCATRAELGFLHAASA